MGGGSAGNGFLVPGGLLASGKPKLGLEVPQRPQNPAQPHPDLCIRGDGLIGVKVGSCSPVVVIFFSPDGFKAGNMAGGGLVAPTVFGLWPRQLPQWDKASSIWRPFLDIRLMPLKLHYG